MYCKCNKSFLILQYKYFAIMTSTISIRVDQTLKKNFDSLCDMFGLSTTAAFNIFMKAVVRERKIPFEIRADKSSSTRDQARDAFNLMRQSVADSELPQMSIDEINAEIKAARDERKRKNICRD